MNWSRRELGLGAALVLAVAAAIAVPAWAGDNDPASVEPSLVASGGVGGAVVEADGPGAAVDADEPGAVRVAVEPDGLGDCLRRHGANLPVPRFEGDELAVPRPHGAKLLPPRPEGGELPVLHRRIAKLPAPRPESDRLPVPKLRRHDDDAFRRAAEACGAPLSPRGPDPFPLTDKQIESVRDALTDFVSCMSDHGQDLGEPEVDRNRIVIPLPPDAFSEQFLDAQRACGGPPVGP
jgi:hypothetical protein